MRQLAIYTIERFIQVMQQNAILRGEVPYSDNELLSILCRMVDKELRPATPDKTDDPLTPIKTTPRKKLAEFGIA